MWMYLNCTSTSDSQMNLFIELCDVRRNAEVSQPKVLDVTGKRHHLKCVFKLQYIMRPCVQASANRKQIKLLSSKMPK